jgi:hypothetical protein
MKTNQNVITNIIRNSSGRFFGLETTNGSVLNARFVKETPTYFVVHDRNSDETRHIAKSKVSSVTFKGMVVHR